MMNTEETMNRIRSAAQIRRDAYACIEYAREAMAAGDLDTATEKLHTAEHLNRVADDVRAEEILDGIFGEVEELDWR